jgi:hypothetical protein
MFKFYKKISLFFAYRKNIILNKTYLLNKYGLKYNFIYELYTTIVLTDAPSEMKQQYGNALASHEIKKYIKNFNFDLEKLELQELVNIYEIKKINDDLYGIAFGYALMKNIKIYLYLLLHIIGIVALVAFLIFLI